MSSDKLTILCPAKINLALSVGAARAEDGMHPISSWMTRINLCDTLILTRSLDGQSLLDIQWKHDAPLPQAVNWPLSSDLAFRAHALMQEEMGRVLPVKAVLQKSIPTGAGLGGGSGNAAGMLTGLNTLFKLGLDDGELAGLGLSLGSDVMFMVVANTDANTALVSGIGDEIDLIPCKVALDIVLILPTVSCSTAAVYQAFDRITRSPTVNAKRVTAMVHPRPFLKDNAPYNDLTEAAFAVQPTLRTMRDQVQEVTEMPVHLSGSGSAMFIVVQGREEAMELSKTITDRTGLVAICAGSLSV